jgi:hypothetical protein
MSRSSAPATGRSSAAAMARVDSCRPGAGDQLVGLFKVSAGF